MYKFFILLTFLILPISGILSQSSLKVGDNVSAFSATDDQGNKWNSDEAIQNKIMVVYFYPAAMTGGCTKQACAYRDDKTELDKLGAVVVGISGDEASNLNHFKQAYQLNFPLLSDADGSIAKIFGVPTKEGGTINRVIEGQELFLKRGVTTARWTFIIGQGGKLIYKNSEVNAAEDSKNVKEIIQNYLANKY